MRSKLSRLARLARIRAAVERQKLMARGQASSVLGSVRRLGKDLEGWAATAHDAQRVQLQELAEDLRPRLRQAEGQAAATEEACTREWLASRVDRQKLDALVKRAAERQRRERNRLQQRQIDEWAGARRRKV